MHEAQTTPGLQPLLHDSIAALRAPMQVWSARDGGMGAAASDGVYLSDVRVVRALRVELAGTTGEHLTTLPIDAGTVRFVALHRALDDNETADPGVRATLTRRVTADGVVHEFALDSRLGRPIAADLVIELVPDLTTMERVKSGLAGDAAPAIRVDGTTVRWGDENVAVALDAPGAAIEQPGARRPGARPLGALRLTWRIEVPPNGTTAVGFALQAADAAAVAHAPTHPVPWRRPDTSQLDDRLARWLHRALDDLDALRIETPRLPGEQVLAAGAPWFLTLFGRDSIWAARMLLPLGTGLAGSTLRVLAELQGRRHDPETAEQPGKIMHELRREPLALGDGVRLPPLYYGTVDATPLWICLLAEARDAGLPDGEVRALLPHLEAALAWMRDDGNSDGDGLLEYVDESGHGLSNQGWKDSGDSVQWRDGRLAQGPIALCEVQAYAYQAAVRGAELLDAYGRDGGEWRRWADRLAARFRETFWIDDPRGAYPAIALDAGKHPVDTATSNLGHLLGTGLLDPEERALVARRLVSPELDSGYGLRTMSTDAVGYWPLGYHAGSVWTHDTAIAVSGLAADGFPEEAAQLAEGLLRAAVAFDYRMPELHSGDAAVDAPAPVPYPAACRPQAWSAAAAVTVYSVLRESL